MEINEKTIWSCKQNHPELVIQDCVKEFSLTEDQQEKLRCILRDRGINKWLYARRLFIKLKHEIKERLKTEDDKRIKKIYAHINERMQNIARMPRYIVWGRVVHKTWKNNEKEIVIKGRHC